MNYSEKLRSEILTQYYSESYKMIFNSGAQSFGTNSFHKAVEKYWESNEPKVILEIGAGNGEHFKFVNADSLVNLEKYIALDIKTPENLIHSNFSNKLEWLISDASNLPLEQHSVDRVVVTCLLHHVKDPFQVLLEIKRVLKPGGEFAIVMPTDPGILNRLIKKIITKPKMKKFNIQSPNLLYAFEHPNKIDQLLTFLEILFAQENKEFRDNNNFPYESKSSKLIFKYAPFKFPSWNFNYFIVAKGKK